MSRGLWARSWACPRFLPCRCCASRPCLQGPVACRHVAQPTAVWASSPETGNQKSVSCVCLLGASAPWFVQPLRAGRFGREHGSSRASTTRVTQSLVLSELRPTSDSRWVEAPSPPDSRIAERRSPVASKRVSKSGFCSADDHDAVRPRLGTRQSMTASPGGDVEPAACPLLRARSRTRPRQRAARLTWRFGLTIVNDVPAARGARNEHRSTEHDSAHRR